MGVIVNRAQEFHGSCGIGGQAFALEDIFIGPMKQLRTITMSNIDDSLEIIPITSECK